MITRLPKLTVLLFCLAILLGMQVSTSQAATCSIGTKTGWYPPTYSYSDSFVSLFGKTQVCWSGENFSHQGYSQGAQYPGIPLSQIRAYTRSWEEAGGSRCTPIYSKDSGWKYNVMSVWAIVPYRHWQCSGDHFYVAYTTHYFGSSNQHITGNK